MLIVFYNGTVPSKIGKVCFFALALFYVLKYGFSLNYKKYYWWLIGYTILCVSSILWADSESYAISGATTVFLNFVCLCLFIQIISGNDNWLLQTSKCIIILPSCLMIRLVIENGMLVFTNMYSIPEHNSLGFFAAMGAVFGYYDYMTLKNKKLIKFSLLDLMFVLISMSRKAIIYLLIPAIILYIFSSSGALRKIKKIIVVLLVVIAGVFLVIKVPFLYEKIGKGIIRVLKYKLIGMGDSSSAARFDRIQFGLKLFHEKPLFGHGILNFNYYFSQTIDYGMDIADNNFIDNLANLGIVGLIMYYRIYYLGFREVLKGKNLQKYVFPVAVALSLLICDYGVSSYIYLHMQTILCICISCIIDINTNYYEPIRMKEQS